MSNILDWHNSLPINQWWAWPQLFVCSIISWYFLVESFSDIIFVESFSFRQKKPTHMVFYSNMYTFFICTYYLHTSVEKEFVSMAPSSLLSSSSIIFVSISISSASAAVPTPPRRWHRRNLWAKASFSFVSHMFFTAMYVYTSTSLSLSDLHDISSLQLRIRSLHDFKFNSLIIQYYTPQHKLDLNDQMEMGTLLN